MAKPRRTRRPPKCLGPRRHSYKRGRLRYQAINLTRFKACGDGLQRLADAGQGAPRPTPSRVRTHPTGSVNRPTRPTEMCPSPTPPRELCIRTTLLGETLYLSLPLINQDLTRGQWPESRLYWGFGEGKVGLEPRLEPWWTMLVIRPLNAMWVWWALLDIDINPGTYAWL